ncbi:MAG TPA: SusC/RagA family TonB-linked outer membrane protein, partial [Crocinitomix sp.]|nr:SusC/RagA family TonB-linked outer membrane protein [Crocinitomix sp.]
VEKVVGASSKIDVTVKESGESLAEVVITGFGNKTRDQLTSAVSIVTGEDLAKMAPSTTIDNMLQGKASGVNVTGANGQPGQTAYVRIRGVGSINASSAPLYVVDGVVGVSMNSINPNDIESMSILKDAATASLYGSRGANGVIVITTKQGRNNKNGVISVNSTIGYGRKINDTFEMMNTTQKLQYEAELSALGVAGANPLPGAVISTQAQYDYYSNLNHDWQKTLLRKAYLQSNSVSFSGGSDNSNYFLSLGHDRNTGIIKDISGFEKITGRVNLGFDIKEWLNIQTNFGITHTTSDEPRDRNNVQNPFRAMYDYNPYEPLYNVDSNGNTIYDVDGNPEYNLTSSGFSISEALVNNPEEINYIYTTASVAASAKINDKLTNTFKVGGTNRGYKRDVFIKPGSVLDGYVGDANAPGIKTDNGSNSFNYTVTNILDYQFDLKDKHLFKVSGLFEFNKTAFKSYRLSSKGFSNPDLSVQEVAAEATEATTSFTETSLLSYGAFLNYNFDGKYLATASFRRDGASQFGENNKFGNFWSVSAAWNLHNEQFLEDSSFINSLKLRASIGTSGNRSVGNYSSIPTVSLSSLNNVSNAYIGYSGNPDLKWETQTMTDIGLEFRLFDNKISGVIDYYTKTTKDLLLFENRSSIGGDFSGGSYNNVGEMVNKGIEIELSADLYKKNDLYIKLGGNITFIDNEITKLVPTSENPEGAPILRGETILQVGEEFNTFNLVKYAGVNEANGEPLFYDANGNVSPIYDSNATEVLSGKSSVADFDGGLNFYTSYKGFDFGADFYFKYGHYIMNYMASNMLSDGTSVDSNQRVDAFNYWKNPGDTDVLPSPLYGNEAQQSSDRFLQRGDYIRLRNLSFGYTLPSKYLENIQISSLRFYIQGQNFWTYAPYFAGDPEVGIGSGETTNEGGFGTYNLYSYPQTQSVSVGLNLKF